MHSIGAKHIQHNTKIMSKNWTNKEHKNKKIEIKHRHKKKYTWKRRLGKASLNI